jgi:hypothetical protein
MKQGPEHLNLVVINAGMDAVGEQHHAYIPVKIVPE